jgi:hypothetical protein
MGRHKKDCTCELCVSKKKENKIKNKVAAPASSAAPNEGAAQPPAASSPVGVFNSPEQAVEVVLKTKQEEIHDNAENKVLFQMPQEANTKPAEAKPDEAKLVSQNDTQAKIDTIKPLVQAVLPALYNTLFTVLDVRTLNEDEERGLVETTSLVLSKYSSVYDFKYKEEVALVGMNLAIFMPRIAEYRAKKAAKLLEAQKDPEGAIEVKINKPESAPIMENI